MPDPRRHNLFQISSDMRVGDAVCALIVVEDGRYLMQLRDDKPGIFYPAHWGLFGGAVEPGESPEEALVREIEEELGFQPRQFSYFTRLDLDYGCIGDAVRYRLYYEIPISAGDLPRMVLGEGDRMAAFAAPELLLTLPVTPYDAYPIWLHHQRAQLTSNHRQPPSRDHTTAGSS